MSHRASLHRLDPALPPAPWTTWSGWNRGYGVVSYGLDRFEIRRDRTAGGAQGVLVCDTPEEAYAEVTRLRSEAPGPVAVEAKRCRGCGGLASWCRAFGPCAGATVR